MKVSNIFKGVIGLLTCLLLLLSLNKSAHADVIWEPNDDFYNKNREDCEAMARTFLANGADGSVRIKKNPDSNKTLATLDNGTSFFVSFTYKKGNGEEWGVVEYDEGTGWLLMEDLVLVYDNIVFLEEHNSELKDYNGEFDDYVIKEEEPVILWTYPGSGVAAAEIKQRDDKISFSDTYTDAEGRQWGYIVYYYGSEGWVCFTDPTNKDIPVTQTQNEVTIIPPDSDQSDASADTGQNNEVLLTVFLVAALVIVTAILIRVFWKRRK